MLGCTWVRRRWTEATKSSSAGSAYPEEVEDESVGSGASRSDSLLQEGGVDEAKLPVHFDLHGRHRKDGGELGNTDGTVELG